MKKSRNSVGLLVLAIGFIVGACTHEDLLPYLGSGEDSPAGVVTNQSSAVEKALALFPGTVREVEIEVENGIRTWKVDIVGDEGSEVEIYITEANGDLFRIDGEVGPFSYEILPGDSFISFMEAKSIAEAILTNGFSEWRLRRDDSYQNEWVYTFTSGEIEVVIRAYDGELLDRNEDASDDDSSSDDNSNDDSSSDDDSNNNDGNSSLNRSTAMEKALSLFAGTVREIQREVEEGVATWKVEIIGNGGAEVEIYLRESNGAVFRIDGESGPFSYDIHPGSTLISFSKAKQTANAQTSESLEEWRLRKDDSFNNQWVYEFKYEDTEVIVRATDANVLEVKD